MAKFMWLGLNARGELRQYDLIATQRTDATQEARQQAATMGVQLVEIRKTGRAATQTLRQRMSFTGLFRKTSFNLSLFAAELLALLRAGLALTEVLDTLVERQREATSVTISDGSRHVLSGLLRFMQQGKSFSSALAAYPEQFPTLFVAMMAASEQTGEMSEALARYLHYHEQISLVRQKLISASLYPGMLLLTGGTVALFLICFLAPRFGHVYEGMTNAELPTMSRGLIALGLFVSDHIIASTVFLTACIAGSFAVAVRPATRQQCLGWIASVAWIGDVMKLMQMGRFYRSTAMLLQGGVPVLTSLEMTRDLLPAERQTALARSMLRISEGKALSESLHREALLTPIALRLLKAGERNGQIAGMLEQAALFHEREIAQWVERFVRLVEPTLMLVMGIGIGLIVVLLYLPIFDLAGSLQ
ncbi:type II secretion system F family protein [Burkholderia sp. Ac-20365]|uniref:type II secretion system F family protein n=1 Tax=Burkholderia sp. Ac-20365 TaxID=2703897 RepID=UPI00197C5CED|nr:type II secretion system F family protein [Burkholderia sp. Ac-20365]MBN3759426.1 type II secretion system F family protein [Burkholderia sp. Ac-20365]